MSKSIAKTELYVALTEHAKFLGHAEPGSKEWGEFRQGRIGGSEVGAIAGESKYESAYSLWAKKLELIPSEQSDSEPMYWGRALEPVIIDRVEQDHPELKIFRDVGTWVNKHNDFMLATPDALYQREDGRYGVIEIKTARFPDEWGQGVPRYYLTQVQWYLATLGLSEAIVAVLISGSDYREYAVEADVLWQNYDLDRVRQFLYAIETKSRPEWDGSESTVQAVRAMHPEIEYDSEVELGDLGVLYSNALHRANEAEREAKAFEAAVLDAMGNARTGLIYDEPKYIRTARGQGRPFLKAKKV